MERNQRIQRLRQQTRDRMQEDAQYADRDVFIYVDAAGGKGQDYYDSLSSQNNPQSGHSAICAPAQQYAQPQMCVPMNGNSMPMGAGQIMPIVRPRDCQESGSGSCTWAWIFLILLLVVAGIVLYNWYIRNQKK
jgi:hypothetical protein